MQNYAVWGALGLLAAYFFLRPGAAAEDTMNAQELRGRLAAESALQLVDVRTPEEFAEGHLKGAKNIPLDALQARAGEIAKDKAVALYCRSGRRSASALSQLKSLGFKDVKHLDGGILAWKREGL